MKKYNKYSSEYNYLNNQKPINFDYAKKNDGSFNLVGHIKKEDLSFLSTENIIKKNENIRVEMIERIMKELDIGKFTTEEDIIEYQFKNSTVKEIIYNYSFYQNTLFKFIIFENDRVSIFTDKLINKRLSDKFDFKLLETISIYNFNWEYSLSNYSSNLDHILNKVKRDFKIKEKIEKITEILIKNSDIDIIELETDLTKENIKKFFRESVERLYNINKRCIENISLYHLKNIYFAFYSKNNKDGLALKNLDKELMQRIFKQDIEFKVFYFQDKI